MICHNPLTKYFRQPGIYLTLPSRGYYNKNDIDTSMDGEVGILPMTAQDEILVNNPDSLLNGSALEHIVSSCCPGIRKPRDLPIIDVDVIILATKMITYGDKLELFSQCPECKKGVEIKLSIRELLDKIRLLPTECPVRINDDLIVYIRPYSLNTANKLNMAEFEENKLLQNIILNTDDESKKINAFTASFRKITKLHLETFAECVMKIHTPEGSVKETDLIQEFIINSDRNVIDKMQKTLTELNSYGLPSEHTITCDDETCNFKWNTNISYNPSSFFVKDS